MAGTATLTVDELEARTRDLSPQAAAELLARFLTARLARVAGGPALPAPPPSDPARDCLLTVSGRPIVSHRGRPY